MPTNSLRQTMFSCLALWAAISSQADAATWRTAQLFDLTRAAAMAPAEGLAPRADLERLENTGYASASGADAIVDKLADNLFESLANAYARGDVEPRSVDKDWRIARPALDLARLKQDLEAGAMPSALLASLLPQTPEYNLLRQQLALVSAEPPGKERDDKLLRIRANLERLRWLPRILPAARVEVRIPAYRLDLYRGARVVSHDVIVGARRTPSPTFAAEIQSVTLNPVWDPPASIERELISRFRRNRAAAVRERFEGVLPNGQIVDAAQINWNAKPFVYDIRQRPGPANALGLIRFNLPNPYAVYLHDTPSRALFDREKRALSHGCIRVRDPMALAIALLDSAEWDEASLAAAAKPGETVVVSLPTSIPVYILYMTTDINDGAITYYGDVYRRDQVIVDALDKAQTAS